MISFGKSKITIFKKITKMIVFNYIAFLIILPIATIQVDSNGSIFQEKNIAQLQSQWFEKIGDKGLFGKGFGLNSNIATRGVVIYNNELYIGTENLNRSKSKSYLPHIVSLILQKIIKKSINQTYKFVQDLNPLEPEIYSLDAFVRPTLLNKFIRLQHHYRTFCSDGGEIWKYNYTTDLWTQIIGSNSINGINSGFNYSFNCAISVLKEFKGKLYAGTWNTPIGSFNNPNRKGCEIWRYDGNIWEQVVGSDTYNFYGRSSGGFGNPNNVAAWSIEEFNGFLYIGTMNWKVLETGACEIWRSFDGINWECVVEHGFRSNMSLQDLNNSVMNNYAWIMKNYSGRLYVGTFNYRGANNPELVGAGCQLWSSSDGVSWIKEPLPDGDGFGEGANWGIRRMEIYDGALYLGTATNFKCIDEGCEIWRYNVSQEQANWTCIVGDKASPGRYTRDGFNDTENRYVWSTIVTADGLYVGTSNKNGCRVYLYNLTSGWTAIVKTRTNEELFTEQPDGFGDRLNYGVRSMIEYPLNSKNVFLGTFTSYWKHKWAGCEIWVRYS